MSINPTRLRPQDVFRTVRILATWGGLCLLALLNSGCPDEFSTTPGGAPPATAVPVGTPPGQAAQPTNPAGTFPGTAAPTGTPPQTGFAPATVAAVPAVALQYRFQPKQQYYYSVNILADGDDEAVTFSGTIVYTVQSVDANGIRMTHAVSLPRSVKTKKGRSRIQVPMGPPRFEVAGPREMTINAFGNVISNAGDSQISYLLGNKAELIIEPLSPQGQNRWNRTVETQISETSSGGSPFPFPTHLQSKKVTNMTATEVVNYEVASTAGNLAVIRKTSDLKTNILENGVPRIQMQGTGEIKFDLQAGVPQSGDYKATLTFTEGNTTERIPITVSYRRMEAGEIESYKAQKEAQRAESEARLKKMREPKAIGEVDITQALEDLKSNQQNVWKAALDKLVKAVPVESRREEVAAALEPLLKERDGGVRTDAAKALIVWGTPKSVPALIPLLGDESVWARGAAMDALAATKDPKAAEALAERLDEFGVRGHASKALKAMGATAEKALVPLLKHKDWGVRLEACKILGEIGTNASISALRGAAGDSNGHVKGEATRAIQAIQGRK